MPSRKDLPFFILTFSVFTALVLPGLMQDGMFMDGQQYACVAKNLAHGRGTFWFPFLSKTWAMAGSNNFMEQTPLVYGIQSFFFRFFGDSMYVERFYCLLAAILTASLIIQVWRIVPFEDKRLNSLGWLPVLFWIIIPTCFWGYHNNILENTMGVFTLLSVFLVLKAMQVERNSIYFLIVAGITIFLASLSKGVPGLFPLATIIIYWLVFPSRIAFSKALAGTILLIAVPVLIYVLLLQYQPAHDSLLFYFKERLLFRVNNNPTVNNRFYIIQGLFEDLLPSLILCLLTVVLLRRKYKEVKYDRSISKNALFFFLLGAAASLPILLTPVQKKFYLQPAFPFFGIGMVIIAAPYVLEWLGKILNSGKSIRILTYTGCFLMVCIIAFSISQAGKASRDKDMLHDVYAIGKIVPSDSIITINKSLEATWNLQFYLLRYFDISSSPSEYTHGYYLEEKASPKLNMSGYEKVPVDLRVYELYKRSF